MNEATMVNSPSHEEDLNDVGCNADLYASRQGAFQGYNCNNYFMSDQNKRLIPTSLA